MLWADLNGASSIEVDFSCAKASQANISETNCARAKFISATLDGANLSQGNFQAVDFFNANLTGGENNLVGLAKKNSLHQQTKY